jgi:hypothetical protein
MHLVMKIKTKLNDHFPLLLLFLNDIPTIQLISFVFFIVYSTKSKRKQLIYILISSILLLFLFFTRLCFIFLFYLFRYSLSLSLIFSDKNRSNKLYQYVYLLCNILWTLSIIISAISTSTIIYLLVNERKRNRCFF